MIRLYVKFEVGTVVDDSGAGVDFASIDVFVGDAVIVADIDKDHEFDGVA